MSAAPRPPLPARCHPGPRSDPVRPRPHRRYVLDHAALALLPDFPPHAPKKTPVEAVELCAAPGGEPSVRISWSGGGESIVSCERFKSLAGV